MSGSARVAVSRSRETDDFPSQAASKLLEDRSACRDPPRVLILVGIPGSGKSTFARNLVPHGWVRINQDEAGSRSACETMAKCALLEGRDIVIDRCNFDATQRAHWIEMGRARGCAIGCIVFRESLEVCVSRVLLRLDHPTLKANDQESAEVVKRMAREFSFPTQREGIDYCRVVDSSTCFDTLAASLHLYRSKQR